MMKYVFVKLFNETDFIKVHEKFTLILYSNEDFFSRLARFNNKKKIDTHIW